MDAGNQKARRGLRAARNAGTRDADARAFDLNDRNGLVFYLVSRFIAVLVCVMVAESLVVWMESVAFVPMLERAAEGYASQAPPGTTSAVALLQGVLSLLNSALFASRLPVMGVVGKSMVVGLVLAMLLLLVVPMVLGALVFASMVAGRIRILQQRREQELLHIDRQRSQFITDVAHDLRTPLMAISGMAHALSDGVVQSDATRAEYLQAISDKADKMGDLVSSVFDYTKLDSAGYSLSRSRIDLPQLLLREAAIAYTDAEEAGMQLEVHVSEERCVVDADSVQLARVVANLLANAVRHNPPGTQVALMLVRQAGVAWVVVADSGTPIDDDPDDLFQPFTRGDASRSTAPGSGLGLSICKRVADMHGFELLLEQPYGRFTKAFALCCPVQD